MRVSLRLKIPGFVVMSMPVEKDPLFVVCGGGGACWMAGVIGGWVVLFLEKGDRRQSTQWL